MGFRPIQEQGSFISFLRFEADGGVCILILDGWPPEIEEDHLVVNLDRRGVNLAEFWNHYDAIGGE
jgi:hypothetical protein